MNEHSIVSLIPKYMKSNEVTQEEIEYAKKILTSAYKQKNDSKNVNNKKKNNITNYNNNIRKIKKKNLLCFLNNIKL